MNETVKFSSDELETLVSESGGKRLGNTSSRFTAENVCTDTRTMTANCLFLAFSGEKYDAHDFLENIADNHPAAICINMDKTDRLNRIPENIPVFAVPSTLQFYQRLAKFHRMRFPCLRLLALTGSCGKTSTKEAVRAILEYTYGKDCVLATEGNTNNQFGVPKNLLRLHSGHKTGILEMGTNHHGEIEPLADCVQPESSMIVSIGNCHLEFLGSLEGVAREKSHIFKFLPASGTAVIPREAVGFDIMKQAAGSHRIVTFGTTADADFQARYSGGNLYGSSFALTKKSTGESAVVQWHIPGAHQACNAAGAAALADTLGIPFDKIAAGLANTTLPGMRMRIAEHAGATWINDAYNANPDSMKASLQWLSEFAEAEKLVLALGDMGELGTGSGEGHRSVLSTAARLFPKARIITVGAKMKVAAAELDLKTTVSFDTSADAAARFHEFIKPGDTIFLKASRSTGMEKIEPENGL